MGGIAHDGGGATTVGGCPKGKPGGWGASSSVEAQWQWLLGRFVIFYRGTSMNGLCMGEISWPWP